MKRSGMPKRKTALRSDPAKAREWERRSRSELPAKSKRKIDEDAQRRKLKRALLIAAGMTTDGAGPISKGCSGAALVPEVTCASPFGGRPRFEMHEVVKRGRWRRGAVVRENCVLLCQAHHDWTEAEPERATEVGLLASAPHVHPFDKFDER